MKATILDYGAGNLHSLAKAISATGARVTIESDALEAIRSDALILPGVGAFASAVDVLSPHRVRIVEALDNGLPCLGICLGMQLLFNTSEEGTGEGLGVISGRVRKLAAHRVPQIGWNDVESTDDPVFYKTNLKTAYFANSYVCDVEDQTKVIAWSEHEEDRFAAAVRSRNIVGVQFHPEKSSTPGCQLISAFLESIRQ